jgi:hypothetical protein
MNYGFQLYLAFSTLFETSLHYLDIRNLGHQPNFDLGDQRKRLGGARANVSEFQLAVREKMKRYLIAKLLACL